MSERNSTNPATEAYDGQKSESTHGGLLYDTHHIDAVHSAATSSGLERLFCVDVTWSSEDPNAHGSHVRSPADPVAVATLVLPTAAGAQTGLASITGIVSDESGAAVPGLTTATNQATNIGYTGVTNEAGNYIITSVPISTYVIATPRPAELAPEGTHVPRPHFIPA